MPVKGIVGEVWCTHLAMEEKTEQMISYQQEATGQLSTSQNSIGRFQQTGDETGEGRKFQHRRALNVGSNLHGHSGEISSSTKPVATENNLPQESGLCKVPLRVTAHSILVNLSPA